MDDLATLAVSLSRCRRCPRLVDWREQVAVDKRAAFVDEDYWGRPVPGFGDPRARLVVVGLAPAAHGANRTGRMFTGDDSADWLLAAMHRAGFANQPTSERLDDGLTLIDAWMTAAVRCAPPGNRPTPQERDTCGDWLDAELALLDHAVVYLVLGRFAYEALWRHLRRRSLELPRPRPGFAHGRRIGLDGVELLLSYHPSRQNTFTGKLTKDMLDGVFESVREAIDARVGDELLP